ncbi:uncharacterized protein LOC130649027 [Hydractinia symbiolongicarpus]|uniref:uncharacterized protein LOC130649027 n=1 Tax=Hydractinia symbiolongicarpus TaxID=13093 RepID=UPI00254C4820|nr:uncharacterized protein LOC130649027 [Hydractinia symbiolongicarpus]
MFNNLESYCQEVDLRIATIHAQTTDGEINIKFAEFMANMRILINLQNESKELEDEYDNQQEHMNWMVISKQITKDEFEKNYKPELDNLEFELKEKHRSIKAFKEKYQLEIGSGPCVSSLDDTLQELGVERQAYHGKSFIGNHCHKMLKDGNIKYLCDRIPEIVQNQCDDQVLYLECQETCKKFEQLFKLYGSCHSIFNSSCIMTQEMLSNLETSINQFMCYLRVNWPSIYISPKLHILEDHVLDFVNKWRTGLGFYGEQGGESIYHDLHRMRINYSNIKNPVDRLKYIMKQHLLTTNPEAQDLKPAAKKRKFTKGEEE